MAKSKIGAADSRSPENTIAWRQFWLANVITDTGRPAPIKPARPERPHRKDSLSRRLHRLHHMRATLR
jgi:hypothetical protein